MNWLGVEHVEVGMYKTVSGFMKHVGRCPADYERERDADDLFVRLQRYQRGEVTRPDPAFSQRVLGCIRGGLARHGVQAALELVDRCIEIGVLRPEARRAVVADLTATAARIASKRAA